MTGIAESIQQTLAQAGIKMEIIPGDGKQTLTKYRARNHDIYIGQWGQDYFDPNSNAETFTVNPDNSDEGKTKTLAWRNAWDVPELTEADQGRPAREGCRQARRHVQGPAEDGARQPARSSSSSSRRKWPAIAGNLKGFKLGPSFDTNYVGTGLQGIDAGGRAA